MLITMLVPEKSQLHHLHPFILYQAVSSLWGQFSINLSSPKSFWGKSQEAFLHSSRSTRVEINLGETHRHPRLKTWYFFPVFNPVSFHTCLVHTRAYFNLSTMGELDPAAKRSHSHLHTASRGNCSNLCSGHARAITIPQCNRASYREQWKVCGTCMGFGTESLRFASLTFVPRHQEKFPRYSTRGEFNLLSLSTWVESFNLLPIIHYFCMT